MCEFQQMTGYANVEKIVLFKIPLCPSHMVDIESLLFTYNLSVLDGFDSQ